MQENENLKLYTTDATEVRNMTAKDTGIGISSIWNEKDIGSTINEQAKGFALKGEIAGKTKLEIEVTINTSENEVENVYANNAMAQVYVDSEQMQTGTVKSQVVSRKIQGKVWEDSNRNGTMESSENKMSGVIVKLLNNNNAEVGRTTTNAQGEYEFTDLVKGIYKVEVDNLHELTEKEVGTNKEINSKFNQETKQTNEITKLNSISAPELIEDNINAGIRKIQYHITTKVEGIGGNISGEGNSPYESVDKGKDSVKDLIITPNAGYRVERIIINGKEISFTEEANHRVILSKFTNMQEHKEIVVSFEKIATNVLVHHYKEGTTEKVPSRTGGIVEDEVIAGKVGDNYTTRASSNIAQNYELVATPANSTGIMAENQIVVTYYYRLKTPSITNQVINKTGTDRITIANQEMSYTVAYRANVVNYIGDAEVTIVYILPHAIDEAKSDLAGGTYDAKARTITWKENVGDINSFANGGAVEVTKTFKVVYVGLDMNQEKVANHVRGNIKLKTPEKTSEEVTGSQESTIYKAIISAEKLVDKKEATEGEKVTYTVRIKNEGNLAKTVTLRDTLPAGLTFDKNTLIQVGNVGTVYTEQNLKNGIPVEVPAKGTVDVKFAGIVDVLANDVFSKTLENQATIDNELTNKVTTNVTKPNILAHKESVPSSGNKVLEGDEITYKIKVRNDGTQEGTVVVKEIAKPGTAGSTTTQDQTNPNKWNDIFENLPKYDANNKEIQYTLTEEEKTEGDLKYYDSVVTDKIVTNTNKYRKVTVHHYIMNTDGSTTTTKVLDATGKAIEDVVIEGKVGDPYKTESAKNINERYELVAEKLPANATGTIEKYNAEKPQEVIYYYKLKPAKVIINYLEKDEDVDDSNNQVLENRAEINGYVDEKYNTNINHRKETITKENKTYTLVSDSGNTEGTMKLQDTVVTYCYAQKAVVEEHHIDILTNKETGELQSSKIVIDGSKDDEYKTEEKEFEYYTLLEKELPQNAEGKMKVEIVENEKDEKIVNNTIDVYYYYQAKSSNIGVEKEITGIVVNGDKKEVSNGKIEKVEIYRKKTEETSVQVEYKIKVMNTGEISGNAIIEENIPEGMKLANNDGTWEEKEGKLIKVIPEIGAGETKEYTVLLNWEQTEENMGEKANEVRLVETGNVPGFVDNNDKDNTSKANVIISVETGAEIPVVLLLVLVGLVGLETITLKYAVVLTKKQKKK